jgi:hypothetical protein
MQVQPFDGRHHSSSCLQSNLLQLAPKIIGITERRDFTSEKAKKLLLFCQPSEIDDESENISAGTHIYCLLYCISRVLLVLPVTHYLAMHPTTVFFSD